MSWFPGTTSSGARAARGTRTRVVLGEPAAVGEVAARDHEVRLDVPSARGVPARRPGPPAPEVEVRHVEDAGRHRRTLVRHWRQTRANSCRRVYRDFRRSLPRRARRRRAPQAPPRRAAHARGGRGARPLAAALGVAQGRSRSAGSPSAPSGSASRSAASCSAAGARPERCESGGLLSAVNAPDRSSRQGGLRPTARIRPCAPTVSLAPSVGRSSSRPARMESRWRLPLHLARAPRRGRPSARPHLVLGPHASHGSSPRPGAGLLGAAAVVALAAVLPLGSHASRPHHRKRSS